MSFIFFFLPSLDIERGTLILFVIVFKANTHVYFCCISEPNLLSHTAHSVSKKGVKRRDLNDVELRDILGDLLLLVRMDHVIPYNSEVLTSAIRRGLVSSPPSHMLSDESGLSHTSAAWVPGRNAGLYSRPRLFIPYMEEAKVRTHMFQERHCVTLFV